MTGCAVAAAGRDCERVAGAADAQAAEAEAVAAEVVVEVVVGVEEKKNDMGNVRYGGQRSMKEER